ncbi:MAG: putative F420-dependent oxidoreductase, partial [Glaciecola sp.]
MVSLMKFWQSVAFAPSEELVDIARASDRSGWHGLMMSDHLFWPEQHTTAYPYTADGAPMWEPHTAWPDPWVTMAAMSSVTTNLQFSTNVYIAPARDVMTVAKQVSTLDVLSGGRASLGVGAGWSADEFAQTGQNFRTRGARLNEMIPALRELWKDGWSEFHGQHVDFARLRMEPTPANNIPIYVGGHSAPALRRAVTLGDGWIGTGYTPADGEKIVAEVSGLLDDAGRDRDQFEIIIALYAMPDLELYRRFE